MEEYIDKVKLNLDFYKGTDVYSDGDVEEKLLYYVKSGMDIDDILSKENDWAVLYHLSDIRKNILSWYEFDKEKTALEIGSGCGAVTGALCAGCRQVTCVDLSKRRSTINAYHNKEYDNLEIIVGNFEDVEFTEKYDYVTLIGVLEYSIYYIDSPDPFLSMLKKVKSLLKDDGILFVAIENKYGLKYWAGATEDHTGKMFDGITGYNGVDRVRTFSRDKLEELLKEAGFKENDFYYPVPDYKMPLEIYAEDFLPDKGIINSEAPAYDRERLSLFDEVTASDSLLKDGAYRFFANSFLTVSK